jgi:acetyltransferase-like isoleucine patch superfamily enzyme
MILHLLQGLASRARACAYRLRGVKIDGNCWLRAIEIPRQHNAIHLNAGVQLDRGVVLLASGDPTGAPKIVIGRAAYINRSTMIDASERIEIGAHCMIGPFCYLTDHDHAISREHDAGAGPLISKPTRLGERCWLGAHVTILKGVSIGDGTVVGAGSVVTKSLPAGVVAVGNPARVLRKIAS